MVDELQPSDLTYYNVGGPVSIPSAVIDPDVMNFLGPGHSSEHPMEAQNSELEDDDINLNKKSKARSWVWSHGTRVVDKGKHYWKCNYCKRFAK